MPTSSAASHGDGSQTSVSLPFAQNSRKARRAVAFGRVNPTKTARSASISARTFATAAPGPTRLVGIRRASHRATA